MRQRLRSLVVLTTILLTGSCGVALSQFAPPATQSAQSSEANRQPQQATPEKPAASHPTSQTTPTSKPDRLLPPDSRTRHSLALGNRTLEFDAHVGSIQLTNSSGRILAEVAYTAYLLAGSDTRTRPVAFALNGGPGSASTWLHLGAMGPWHIPLSPAMTQPSAKPTLLPNPETWLDFTDLVFIDPVGTGFSRTIDSRASSPNSMRSGSAPGKDPRSRGSRETGGGSWYWSMRGDIVSIAEVIETWLRKNGRLSSPKLLVGESYGGFRVPRIARLLQRSHGIGVNTLVLLSPVLDFDGRRSYVPGHHMYLLPSLAAATMERRGAVPSRKALAEVENYARTEFIADILRGPGDPEAVDRLVDRIASLTGIAADRVRRYAGRLTARSYMREIYGPQRMIASLYDASLTGLDPHPGRPGSRFADPFTVGLSAPLTSAMLELYARLGWRPERHYELLSTETNRSWYWGNSPNPPQSVDALKEVLALDSRVRVLVTHGFTDLVTPYFASAVQLAQLPPLGDPTRIRLEVYPGGHMHYSRNETRAALKADAHLTLQDSLRVPAP